MEVVEDRLRVDVGRCIGQFICARSEFQFITDHAVAKAPDSEAIDGHERVLAEPDTNLRIFNKPEVHGHRRMAVALAIGDGADDARAKAGRVADALTVTVR